MFTVSSPIQTVTVGFGISPNQPHTWVTDYTVGRELHPAPKNLFICSIIVAHSYPLCNTSDAIYGFVSARAVSCKNASDPLLILFEAAGIQQVHHNQNRKLRRDRVSVFQIVQCRDENHLVTILHKIRVRSALSQGHIRLLSASPPEAYTEPLPSALSC